MNFPDCSCENGRGPGSAGVRGAGELTLHLDQGDQSFLELAIRDRLRLVNGFHRASGVHLLWVMVLVSHRVQARE